MSRPPSLQLSAFGVGVEVVATDPTHLEWLRAQLPLVMAGHAGPLDDHPIQHAFAIAAGREGAVVLFHHGEPIGDHRSAQVALQYLCTRIKVAVAASTTAYAIVHAGVVGIGGRAVVMPAHSFQGKTTLVRALVDRGATYYSDDLALVDRDGLVHPFAKTLSVRGATDDGAQVEHRIESLGGVAGGQPLPVGLVLFTRFAADAVWAPRPLGPGPATLRLAEHTLNVRTHAQVALEVLATVATGGAVLWESDRREADEAAQEIERALRPVADY